MESNDKMKARDRRGRFISLHCREAPACGHGTSIMDIPLWQFNNVVTSFNCQCLSSRRNLLQETIAAGSEAFHSQSNFLSISIVNE